MITAGCYSMHIECDTNHRRDGSLEEYDLAGEKCFIGRTEREAINRAKQGGWLFKRNGKTYCPTCAKTMS